MTAVGVGITSIELARLQGQELADLKAKLAKHPALAPALANDIQEAEQALAETVSLNRRRLTCIPGGKVAA